ncbi:MAG: hypothetical protein MI746_02975 [Pseudomonadales bacterium]|nr:hypothetical protein [Pseudomonadales bacterium]
MSSLPNIEIQDGFFGVLQMNLGKRDKHKQTNAEHGKELVDRHPIFIDGVHSFRFEDDCVLIDLFVLKSTAEDQFGRERAAQLKIPLCQFCYFAKTMARLASQLPLETQQTRRAELALIQTQ